MIRAVALAMAGLALFALIIGDRWPITAWMLYVPAFWLGAAAILACLSCRVGRGFEAHRSAPKVGL